MHTKLPVRTGKLSCGSALFTVGFVSCFTRFFISLTPPASVSDLVIVGQGGSIRENDIAVRATDLLWADGFDRSTLSDAMRTKVKPMLFRLALDPTFADKSGARLATLNEESGEVTFDSVHDQWFTERMMADMKYFGQIITMSDEEMIQIMSGPEFQVRADLIELAMQEGDEKRDYTRFAQLWMWISCESISAVLVSAWCRTADTAKQSWIYGLRAWHARGHPRIAPWPRRYMDTRPLQ